MTEEVTTFHGSPDGQVRIYCTDGAVVDLLLPGSYTDAARTEEVAEELLDHLNAALDKHHEELLGDPVTAGLPPVAADLLSQARAYLATSPAEAREVTRRVEESLPTHEGESSDGSVTARATGFRLTALTLRAEAVDGSARELARAVREAVNNALVPPSPGQAPTDEDIRAIEEQAAASLAAVRASSY